MVGQLRKVEKLRKIVKETILVTTGKKTINREKIRKIRNEIKDKTLAFILMSRTDRSWSISVLHPALAKTHLSVSVCNFVTSRDNISYPEDIRVSAAMTT